MDGLINPCGPGASMEDFELVIVKTGGSSSLPPTKFGEGLHQRRKNIAPTPSIPMGATAWLIIITLKLKY